MTVNLTMVKSIIDSMDFHVCKNKRNGNNGILNHFHTVDENGLIYARLDIERTSDNCSYAVCAYLNGEYSEFEVKYPAYEIICNMAELHDSKLTSN